MRLITLLAVTSFFLVLTSASATECFPAIYSSGAPVVIAIVDNRVLLKSFESEEEKSALSTAKAYGLCIEDYGVKVVRIDPLTKEALEWHKTSGYSVWRK